MNTGLDQEAAPETPASAIEGSRIRVEVNRFERDLGLRLAAVRFHGTRCQVCDFSFEEVYGELGAGYIEVHHLKPLSSHQKPVTIN
jgi:5-methylcytosine-specific restriction protein A